MHRMFLSISAALALSACATPQTIDRVVRVPTPIKPPASLMHCLPAPTKPGDGYTQADVAGFLVDLHEAHGDCEGKLAAIRRYVENRVTEPSP